jgi:hypothetical protein
MGMTILHAVHNKTNSELIVEEAAFHQLDMELLLTVLLPTYLR